MHFVQPTYLSGHEAFSSLVDVASKQPFLPVPSHKDDKRLVHPVEQHHPTLADEMRYMQTLQIQRPNHQVSQLIRYRKQFIESSFW